MGKNGRMSSARELEAKFRVSAPFELPPIAGSASEVVEVDVPTTTTLTATYFDTADLRLAREGITLRRREGGKDPGWHLKLPIPHQAVPDGAGAREEIEVPDSPEMPDDLRDLVAVWVRAVDLMPVATLVTERTTYVLRGTDGAALADLVDDTVSVEDANHVHAKFREIEIEDTGGGPSIIATVGGVLQNAGAVGGEFVPKVVRALGPRATAPPDPPLPRAAEARDPARDVVAATLRQHTRRLMSQDVAVRRDEPDAVHQMRVATRRLRTAFEVFSPLLDETWARSVADEIGWLAGVLGAARDAEVLRERLLAATSDLPEQAKPEAVHAKLEKLTDADLASARATVTSTLASPRYLALIDRLVDAATYPRTSEAANRPAGATLLPLVRTRWQKLADRVNKINRTSGKSGAKAGPPAESSARHLASDYHRVRIAAKHLRYTCDAVDSVFGSDARILSKHAERIQDLLGEDHDATVAAGYLAELAAGGRVGALGFGLGMMFARQESLAARARREFAQLWPGVSQAKRRRWLAD